MVLFSLGEINKNIPGNFERSLTSNTLYQHLCKPPSPQVAQARIRIPFNPTFRTFRWYIKWNEIYIWSDRNIRDQLWRWSTLTGLVGPNWQNWKLLSSVPFFCIQLTRTITKRAAAWVGSVQQECTVPYIWASGISEILYRNFCWMESPPACPWYKSRNHGREDETENLSKVSRLLFQSHCLPRLQKQSFLSPYKSSCFESYQDNIFELGIPVLSKGLS